MTLAGLRKLVAKGFVAEEDRVVLILTGHTLKDSDYTIHFHRDELLNDSEKLDLTPHQSRLHAELRKPPIVLDADRDLVLRALEAQFSIHAPVA